MIVIKDISNNQMIIIPVISWFVAQFLKTLLYIFKNKSFNLERLVGAGGMPSSHSAFVSSLAISVGLHEGFNSTLFAIAMAFALVVMYDACGVRRAAGQQAAIINKLIFHKQSFLDFKDPEKLKEFLGHTPYEVFAGAFLGTLISILLM